MSFLFEQESKNLDYQLKGSVPVIGGMSVSQEYGTDEHPSMATERTETQKGLVKETQSENYEEMNTRESTSYEVGIGAYAVMVGLEVNVGFEYVESSKTEKKPVENTRSQVPGDEQNR